MFCYRLLGVSFTGAFDRENYGDDKRRYTVIYLTTIAINII